jgi:hypothetical protein
MSVGRLSGLRTEEVVMRLSWRDGLATVFVGVGVLVYGLWLADVASAGPRAVTAVVLVLGLAASVTAVVYGVGAGLLRASKVYLVVASLIGLAAAVAGVWALVAETEAMLAILVASTVVLWLMSTVRHILAAQMPEHRPAMA